MLLYAVITSILTPTCFCLSLLQLLSAPPLCPRWVGLWAAWPLQAVLPVGAAPLLTRCALTVTAVPVSAPLPHLPRCRMDTPRLPPHRSPTEPCRPTPGHNVMAQTSAWTSPLSPYWLEPVPTLPPQHRCPNSLAWRGWRWRSWRPSRPTWGTSRALWR